MTAFLSSQTAAHVVLALLHTLWQAGAIAVALALFLRATPARQAERRYVACLGALAGVVLCGLLTWGVLEHSSGGRSARFGLAHVVPPTASIAAAVSPEARPAARGPASYDAVEAGHGGVDWHGWAMAVWLCGVAAMLSRTVKGVWGAGRLRRRCLPVTDASLLETLADLQHRMGLRRRVPLFVSEDTSSPAALGLVWPALLLPLSAVNGIPPEDLRAILAHECAHIRAHDHLVSFAQAIVEALLFFNPAVWAISRQVRIEREARCDAEAVRVTGDQRRYAELLFEWARPCGPGVVATAFAGQGRRTSGGRVLDRVRRVLSPGHRPNLRATWYVVTAGLLASGAILVALARGSRATVELAGRILSPRERIEKMVEIGETHEAATRKFGEEDRVTLSGTVRTADGAPLPPETELIVDSQRFRNSCMTSISPREGTFSKSMSYYEEHYIIAKAPGYATAVAGPFETEPGATVSDIELVLGAGFPARIKVTDVKGHAIAGAAVTGRYLCFRGHYSGACSIDEMATDAQGVALIEHCSDWPLSLDIVAEGHQREERREVRLRPDQDFVWELTPSLPTTGIVVAEQRGQPVPGAEIRLVLRTRPDHNWSYGEPGLLFRRSDAAGRFVLSTLRSDWTYHFVVYAAGYRPQILANVQMGTRGLKVELRPAVTIAGQVLGDLDGLTTVRDGKRAVGWASEYSVGKERSHQSSHAVLEPTGAGGSFRIEGAIGDVVTIRAGGAVKRVDLRNGSVDDLIIDLRPGSASRSVRRVVLQLQLPPGAPPARGEIRVDYAAQKDLDEGAGMEYSLLPVEDGRVTLDVPVPGRLTYGLQHYEGDRLAGYWIAPPLGNIPVPDGDGPFVVRVPAHPAGAIYGQVVHADGSMADDVTVNLMAVRKAPAMENLHQVSDVAGSQPKPDGRFSISPLPLGGSYAIIAHRNNTWVVSDPVELTEQRAIRELRLVLPLGKTLRGRVLLPGGKAPAVDVSVSLTVSISLGGDNSWGSGGPRMSTDAAGRFSFEHVNPDIPGEYWLQVEPPSGCQPRRLEVRPARKWLTIWLREACSLRGVVVDDATGYPVPGVRVHAQCREAERGQLDYVSAEDLTDGEGRFAFSGLAPQEYSVRTYDGEVVARNHEVSATGGQGEPVTLRIKLPPDSRLKPRKPGEGGGGER